MGMPMRPAMSVMESTETPPVSPHDADLQVDISVPEGVRPGVPTPLTIQVNDATTGAPVEDLVRTHQEWSHVIVTRADLGTFAHIHGQPTGEPGRLQVSTTFPTAGRYLVHTEFRRQGQMADVLARQEIVVAGPQVAAQPPSEGEIRTAQTHGVTVRLTGKAEVGETSDFTLAFTDTSTGQPVTGLQPYLGAAGHVVILADDGTGFAHQHAETTDRYGRPVFAVPGSTFGPELDLHATFPTAGHYRLWAQFRLADNTVITAPFAVDADEHE